MSDSLQPHGLQHTRPLCPSPIPEVCPSSLLSVMPSSHLILWFPLFLLPSIFLASGIFPVSLLFISHNKNTGISASASVLPMSIQGWFRLRLTGLNFLLSKGLSGVLSSTTVWRHQFFHVLPFSWSSSQPYVTTGKTIALTIWTFIVRVMSLLFNTLSRFGIAFLPRCKHLLISWP